MISGDNKYIKILLCVLVLIICLTGCKKKVTTEKDIIRYVQSYFDDKVKVVSILDDTVDAKTKTYTLESDKRFEFTVDEIVDKKGYKKYFKTNYINKLFEQNSLPLAKLSNKYIGLRVNTDIDQKKVIITTKVNVNNIDNLHKVIKYTKDYYDFLKSLGIKYDKKDILVTEVTVSNNYLTTINNKLIDSLDQNKHIELLKSKYIEDLDKEKIEMSKKNKDKIYKKYKHTHINKLYINKDDYKEEINFIYDALIDDYIINYDINVIDNILKNYYKIDTSNKNKVLKYVIGSDNYVVGEYYVKINEEEIKFNIEEFPAYLDNVKGKYIKLSEFVKIFNAKSSIKNGAVYFTNK